MATCGGSFVKVKEPEKQVKAKDVAGKGEGLKKGQRDIRDLIKGKENKTGGRGKPKGPEDANMARNKQTGNGVGAKNSSNNAEPSVVGGGTTRAGGGPGAQGGGGRGNIFGFGGTSFGGPGGGKAGGLKTGGKVGTVVVKPGWKSPTDNSSGGSVVNSGGELVAGGSNGPGRQGSTGGSFKLGGSSSSLSSSSSSSVQDMLRRKWGNTGSSSSTSAPAGHARSDPNVPTGQPLQTSKHTASKAKPSAGSSIQNRSKTGSSHSQAEKQQCPICSKFFPAEEINPHLDLVCLLAKADDDNPDQVFDDDGSDADLIAAAQLVEEEDSRINSSKGSIHSISDSDDDEPLLKRACDDKHAEKKRKEEADREDDLFGDTTLQDDLDLLAALENVTTGEQEGDISMFACPVCNTLLNHAVMNEHLDVCIS